MKSVFQSQFLVGAFALRARYNSEYALGVDCLLKKMKLYLAGIRYARIN